MQVYQSKSSVVARGAEGKLLKSLRREHARFGHKDDWEGVKASFFSLSPILDNLLEMLAMWLWNV